MKGDIILCWNCKERFIAKSKASRYCSTKCHNYVNWQRYYYERMDKNKKAKRAKANSAWTLSWAKTPEGKKYLLERRLKKREEAMAAGLINEEGYKIKPHKCLYCENIIQLEKHLRCHTKACDRQFNKLRQREYVAKNREKINKYNRERRNNGSIKLIDSSE